MDTDKIKTVTRHVSRTAEDIAAGKYSAWELIQPLWLVFDIYKSREVYEQSAAGLTDAQRRAHGWVYYNNEVMNGGHQQFLINSTGLIWKETLGFFDMVGAVKFSNKFRKLVRAFGGSIPFDRKERMEAFDKLWYRDGGRENDFMRLLSRLDDEYIKTDISDRLLAMLESYMRSHPQEFVLEGDFKFFDD